MRLCRPILLASGLVALGCSRSGLPLDDLTLIDDGVTTEAPRGSGGATATAVDGSSSTPPVATADAAPPLPDAAPPLPDAAGSPVPEPTGAPSAGPTATPPNPPSIPGCVPTEERCNGTDDDCNGEVDDGLPAVPCEGGGEQYCVAGRYSACPTRCETCLPGSERVCFLSYCTYWATQTCTADGRSFGGCRERHVPPECEDVSSKYKDSPELEQCCIDKGYCCRDEYDLDGDGDRSDMLGRCDEVSCHP